MSDVRLTATNPEDSSAVPVACNDKGELLLQEIPDYSFNGVLEGDLSVTGSGNFASNVTTGEYDLTAGNVQGAKIQSNGVIRAQKSSFDTSANAAFSVYQGSTETYKVNADGSCSFVSGKAGITAEGNFWCTTRRGDTVILDATSNGLATWADYTPPTRKELAQKKLEDWSEKDKPSVSDLDPLENGQIRE